jgi:glycine/D-amino acid oxidase-like deaminating enzyme
MARGFYGSLYLPSGAQLNPVLLVRHIAEESGANLLEHHPVLGIQRLRGQACIETRQRRIRAGQVVLALNAYLPQLYPSLKQYVRPVRAQMLASEPMPPRWLHVPAYTHEGYFYIRQTPDGSLLLGGARHLHRRTEMGYADITTPALQADLEQYMHTHFPQTRHLPVQRRWSGVMGFTPDGLPSFGAVPEQPGSLWAAGFNGHGMGYGFRFGRMLAELTLGYPRPDGADLFDAARFKPPPPAQPNGQHGDGRTAQPKSTRVYQAPTVKDQHGA